ncbi:glycosyltransferase family 4 protein [Bacillus sp. FJAT-27245]|uniref:glycosyltransferase family 4 protein n=1 Tax=Bacillus sp. FJAT-27245 TaxID=1684144 RepID=UPI0006A7CD11|nr:glycosyltransferase [Bacillus sp. FJAT-27245]
MRNFFLIGSINSVEKPNGPANVLMNLIQHFQTEGISYTFINTNTNNFFQKFWLVLKLVFLVFTKNSIINIHSYGYKIPHLILGISKVNKSNKYYLTLHGLMSEESNYLIGNNFYQEYRNNQEKYNKIEKDLIEQFPNLILVSHRLEEIIRKKYNRNENLFVIYNGVKYKRLKPKANLKSRNIKTIMAGGIFSIKSIFELVEGIHFLNKKLNLNISLDVYGGYESEASLQRFYSFIESNDLKGSVHYKGMVSKGELEDLYGSYDFCFCISKFDTFNLTSLESMINGTPVIISRQCGASELISNYKNGFLVEMDNNYLIDLENIFNYLIKDMVSYQNLSEHCYFLASKFTWHKIGKQYWNLFFKKNI